MAETELGKRHFYFVAGDVFAYGTTKRSVYLVCDFPITTAPPEALEKSVRKICEECKIEVDKLTITTFTRIPYP